MNKITIPAPKFEQGELVTLRVESKTLETRIVGRFYEVSNSASVKSGTWFYRLADYDYAMNGTYLESRD